MPSCGIVGCNASKKYHPRLTLHKLPSKEELKNKWLDVIGIENIKKLKSEVTFICSLHFEESCFNRTLDVTRLREDSVPSPHLMPKTKYIPPQKKAPKVMVCRICLKITKKLYSITSYNLEEMFQRLTCLNVNDDERLPQNLCTVCAHRLRQYRAFRENCIQANRLLLGILNTQEHITLDSIQSLGPAIDNLQLKLTKTTSIDKYDLSVIDDDEATDNIEHQNVEYLDNETIDNIETLDGNSDTDFDYGEIINTKYNDNGTEITVEVPRKETEITEHNEQEIPEKVFRNIEEIIETEFRNKQKKKRIIFTVIRRGKRKSIEENGNEMKRVKRRNDMVLKDRRFGPKWPSILDQTMFTVTDLTHEEQLAEIENRKQSCNYKRANFRCNECYRGFLDQNAYNNHMVRHSTLCGEYQCDVCKIRFKTLKRVRKHKTAYHKQKFTCNICSYVCPHRSQALVHERWHKGVTIPCRVCGESFIKPSTYFGHLRKKHPTDCVCELCGNSFISTKGIYYHKVIAHRLDDLNIPEDGPLCEPCNVRFASLDAYLNHLSVSRKHSTDKEGDKSERKRRSKTKPSTYFGHLRKKHPTDCVCELCGNSFISTKGIYYHKVIAHRLDDLNIPEDGPLCEPCNVRFASLDAYLNHLSVSRKHSTDKEGDKSERKRRSKTDAVKNPVPFSRQRNNVKWPMPCEQCGLEMENAHKYFGHFRRVHPDKNRTQYPSMRTRCMCELCGKMFQSGALLKAHKVVHTGEWPYKCGPCGRRFQKKQNLLLHMKRHLPQQPRYECNICGKFLSTAAYRNRHMCLHTGVKPYECELCGRRFVTKSEKRLHITHTHLKNPWPRSARRRERGTRRKTLQPVNNQDQEICAETVHSEEICEETVHSEEICEETVHSEEICEENDQEQEIYEETVKNEELYEETVKNEELYEGTVKNEELYEETVQNEELNEENEQIQKPTLNVEIKQDSQNNVPEPRRVKIIKVKKPMIILKCIRKQ